MNMMSNVIGGAYKDDIVDKTMNEIHQAIRNVYGPFGTDVFIKKNNQTYYTRDGKEVVGTIRFNNSLANDVLAIMYQAIEKQARTAGDGTTTLIVLYVNLYKELKANERLKKYSTSEIRRAYITVIETVTNLLREKVVELDDDLFKSMLFTCTQDPEMAAMIYSNLRGDMEKDSYIIVSKSDIEDDMFVERNEAPIIKCEKIYSFKQVDDTFKSDKMRILYVDGVLDIANEITLQCLLTAGGGYDIAIMCSGLTEPTRRVIQTIKNDSSFAEGLPLNNLIIFRIDNYSAYEKIMKKDLSSIFYNEEELTGITNSMSFEAYLAHGTIEDVPALIEGYKDAGMDVPEIFKFDAAQSIVDRIHYALSVNRQVEYSIGDGLKINSPLNEKTTKRYNALKEAINTEKSAVKRADMIKRLRTIFGVFVEVKVGSQLLKDSQRKFELILDAVVSSHEGFEKGVLRNNSIYELIVAINNHQTMTDIFNNELELTLAASLRRAAIQTFINMLENRYQLSATDVTSIKDYLVLTNTAHRIDMRNSIFPDNTIDPAQLCAKNEGGFTTSHNDIDINMEVVEPFTIIETLLQNSTLAVDLAMSRIFIVDDFMNNYI